jgi:hypothetical protein
MGGSFICLLRHKFLPAYLGWRSILYAWLRRPETVKLIKKIIFMFVLLAGLSFAAMAQKGDDPKKTPPKAPAPSVNPGKGQNPPKGDNKTKKPNGGQAMLRRKESDAELA